MPRPPRIHLEGALSYITSRALEDRRLFRDDRDYRTYLEFLQHYQRQFAFKLFAFMLLPNHLHLCLELTNSTTVSTIMHALNSRYTKYFAKRYGHTGHLFQERFQLTVMEKAPLLLRVTSYLHTYPLRSGLVEDGGTYPWSSYPGYLAAGRFTNGLDLLGEVKEVLDTLSREQPGVTYEQYVRSVPERDWEQFRVELQQRVVGSEAFIKFVEQQVETALRDDPEPAQAAPQSRAPAQYPNRGRGEKATHTASLLLTGRVWALAFLSVCAAGLYATNAASLRQTMHILLPDQAIVSASVSRKPLDSSVASAQLATLIQPSRLAETSWQVQIKPMDAIGNASVETDELRFEGGKVISAKLSAEGFAGSNYSLTTEPEDLVSWETMQTGPSSEIVCWRGEWDGQTMRGILTRQMPGQAATTFSFVAVSKSQRDTSHPTSGS